jgi:hypothetical protein
VNSPRTLIAEDTADLEVISARLQDAVAKVKDLVYLPKRRRFAALFNRFQWEAGARRGNLRLQSGLHIDGVLSAKSSKIKRGAPDAVVSLLAIKFTPRTANDPDGTIELIFSGGGVLKLEVECIDAGLSDISGAWAARGRPAHKDI